MVSLKRMLITTSILLKHTLTKGKFVCETGNYDFCTVPLMWQEIIVFSPGESVVQKVAAKMWK